MAVLGRLVFSGGERLDLADFLSISSYTAADFQYLLTGFVGATTPYILSGFDIIDPISAIGTQSCSIDVSDAAVFYPSSTAGPFFFGLPTSTPLVPELIQNATNYVYITLGTFNTAQDARAFWDPDANGETGGEFTQDVNTESVLEAVVGVNTGGFPTNSVPVAIITMGPVAIVSIEDARDLMFRLGTGGISPNPLNTFAWPAEPNSTYEREEPPTTAIAGGVNPFQGADKNITTLKQWMDAMMSKLKELGGSTYWYEDVSTFSLITSFTDALATTFKTKGEWVHDSATPGLLTWTEDVQIKITADPRTYIVRAGNVTLADEQVAYLDLIRNKPFNSSDQQVAWVNGQSYINSISNAVGLFANLNQGDWVKRPSDPNNLYLRVEQFYDSVNAGGAVTTPALAKSIKLGGWVGAAYQGPTINDNGRYDKGVYPASPASVIVSNRDNAAISAVGGNFSWLALRSDTIEGVASVATTTLSITNITSTADTAVVTTSAVHGLQNGDFVTITGTTNYNGIYQVEVESTTTFSVTIASAQPVETAGNAYYAIVQTAARTNGYGLQLENADHGFSTGDTVIVSNTTNYNGSFKISVRDATHFQMAVGSALASESTGNATLAKVIVRAENGSVVVVQGESVGPDGPIGNIKLFLGMTSDSQTYPDYAATITNVLEGEENFNTSYTESVTARLSNLSAMMADRAQDKTLKYLTEATTAVSTTSGSAQQITFLPAGNNLTILQPGSPGNAVVALPSSAPGISLLVNQSAYVSINRNEASTPSIIVVNTASVPVDENIVVIASRLSDKTIYLWNSEAVVGSAPIGPSSGGLIKIGFYDPVDTTLPTGSVTIDSAAVNTGDLVLFSNLSSGNNEVYLANGAGATITGWTAQYSFNGSQAPTTGDLVIATKGQSFANQIGEFNGTTWEFNNTVRYFNGVDYWEQSALITSSLADNTTNGTVFTVAYAGSEYMIIDYSLNRAGILETGSLNLVTDGTNVSISTGGATLNGASGVSFSGAISGSNLIVRYTTTSTGNPAVMKYSVKRWSNSPGGPAGVPSYSGGGGSGVTSLNGSSGALNIVPGANITVTTVGPNITIASTSSGGTPAGPTNSLQYNNAGAFAGNSEFLVDTVNGQLNLNGLNQTILSAGLTINDNGTGTLFSYAAATYSYAVIEYSIVRNGAFRVGRLLLANDGTITSETDDYTETAATGVTMSSSLVGGNVNVNYTSSNTGFAGTFKYSMRRWS